MRVEWTDYLGHGGRDEFPYDLSKRLGHEDADYYFWTSLPREVQDGIHYSNYEIKVNMVTDMETGQTDVISFEVGGKVYTP